jgi:hypothetical protein
MKFGGKVNSHGTPQTSEAGDGRNNSISLFPQSTRACVPGFWNMLD